MQQPRAHIPAARRIWRCPRRIRALCHSGFRISLAAISDPPQSRWQKLAAQILCPGDTPLFALTRRWQSTRVVTSLLRELLTGFRAYIHRGAGGALLKKAVAPFFWFVSAKAPLLGHPEMGRPVGAGTSGRLPKTAAAPSQLPPGHRRGCTADDALGGTPLLRPGFAC